MEKTLEQFIKEQGITMQAAGVAENPHMTADPEWSVEASHWHLRFFAVKEDSSEGFTCYFSQGSGHKGEPPTAADVLDCLASDAASVENASDFEDWASELGYDTDSRKAYATWQTINTQRDQLQEWLGEEAYQDLLWNVERL